MCMNVRPTPLAQLTDGEQTAARRPRRVGSRWGHRYADPVIEAGGRGRGRGRGGRRPSSGAVAPSMPKALEAFSSLLEALGSVDGGGLRRNGTHDMCVVGTPHPLQTWSTK
jgi:hypothetical protein